VRRGDAAIAYDEAHHVTLMFGGTQASQLDDTWQWDGATWTQLFPNTVPPASSGAMVYDAALGSLVLVLGDSGGAQTWLWDGSDWSQRTPSSTGPTEVAGFGVAYDRGRRRVVYFGGTFMAGGLSNETWEWDGTTWQSIVSPLAPDPRTGVMLVYDEVLGRVVLFGGDESGSQRQSDTWEWDGTTWHERLVATSPPARSVAGITYDRARGRTVIFGGVTGTTVLGDTWTYGFASAEEPRDLCFAGIDTDGDGLAGCADPDCWGVCAPLCPPGTSCDPTQPHCGDMMCSPIESYLTCGDCMPP
jgi:hypothetical protein